MTKAQITIMIILIQIEITIERLNFLKDTAIQAGLQSF